MRRDLIEFRDVVEGDLISTAWVAINGLDIPGVALVIQLPWYFRRQQFDLMTGRKWRGWGVVAVAWLRFDDKLFPEQELRAWSGQQ